MSYYKYAERDADSQINWAEVGKSLSDMLAETNRVREEKKAAIDQGIRETMNYLADTPNGEHIGARQSIIDYADQASNRMRIAEQLLKSGQMKPKDLITFRQNLTDNTNLAFNANKLYQEKYSDVMQGVRDKKYSQLYADNFAEVEGFGDWRNIGWQIGPNGTVMAGKMVEQEIDGKKVRALDKTPGALRSMDYLNQALVSQIDFYNYEDKVNSWVDTLGKEKTTLITLGRIQKQGSIKSVDDITKRKDIVDADKKIMFDFLTAENDQIATITGNPIDAARVLVDSAIFAPNQKQYSVTTSEKEAKANPEKILKVVDPETGGFKFVISEQQQQDANEFVRGQMRAKYNYEEDAQIVGAVQRDPEPQADKDARDKDKKAVDTASMLGKLYYGNNNQVSSAIDYFKGMRNNKGEVMFKSIERDGTGVTVQLADGTTEKISFLDANQRPRTQEDFIRSAGPLLAGQIDVNRALEKGSYQKGAAFNSGSAGSAKTITPKDNYRDYLTSNIDQSIVGKTEEEAKATLSKLADGFGLIVEESGAGDYITIKVPGERTGQYLDQREFSFGESEAATQKEIFEAMVDYMVSNASDKLITTKLKGQTQTRAAQTGTVRGGTVRK